MIEGQEGVTWPQWRAREGVRGVGVPALFRSDHYLNVDGRAERGSLDAWATLTGSPPTRRRCGSARSSRPSPSAIPPSWRRSSSTADHVSGGRVELGLGAGWNEPEHAAYGFPFPPLKARMDMLAEQLEIVHGQWTEGPFSFAGEHYRLEDLGAQPKPVQRRTRRC